MQRKINPLGKNHLKLSEGRASLLKTRIKTADPRLTYPKDTLFYTYRCIAGRPTIGDGIRVDLLPPQWQARCASGITQDECDELLEMKLREFEIPLNRVFAKSNLNDNQFAALVCFSFNLGLAWLYPRNKVAIGLKRIILDNPNNFLAIRKKMLEYSLFSNPAKNGAKEVHEVLFKRRKAEFNLYSTPCQC